MLEFFLGHWHVVNYSQVAGCTGYSTYPWGCWGGPGPDPDPWQGGPGSATLALTTYKTPQHFEPELGIRDFCCRGSGSGSGPDPTQPFRDLGSATMYLSTRYKFRTGTRCRVQDSLGGRVRVRIRIRDGEISDPQQGPKPLIKPTAFSARVGGPKFFCCGSGSGSGSGLSATPISATMLFSY
jgi:hypothetical protein